MQRDICYFHQHERRAKDRNIAKEAYTYSRLLNLSIVPQATCLYNRFFHKKHI